MKNYTNLDLAVAVGNCITAHEVFKLSKIVAFIWASGESINREFYTFLALKRLEKIYDHQT
ncbi:hypothetical protein ACFS5M_12540 [Lacinutrix iliipiscaria]|uniref:Uncharacterized protein n=1 Tax=Lacinutrix iliipiscaria TaxID=1230532 RepID=A0ABW5WPA7_9FLAO